MDAAQSPAREYARARARQSARGDFTLRLPATLESQLLAFRRRVWFTKSIEGVGGAVFGFVASYLCVFALDRALDTPAWVRFAILAAGICSSAVVPLYLHRWIWGQRRFEQLARLVSRRHPDIGDQMLGVIELAQSSSEQARSRALCEAAIAQVAAAAGRRDFSDSVPNPRHRLWSGMAAAPVAAAIGVGLLLPAAAANAWSRFLAPWRATPRYTFASLAELPARIFVARGEPIRISVRLDDDSPWRPALGIGRLGGQSPIVAELRDGRYDFSLPGQIDAQWFRLRIGDARQTALVEPMNRPELASMTVDARLPDYLERAKPVQKDVRGGSVWLVKGSVAAFTMAANRKLSSAAVDGCARQPDGARVTSPPITVEDSRKLEFAWQDEFGLGGQQPFTVSINARDDEPPALACEDLPRHKVALDSEMHRFKLRATDDFGVKRVGIAWRGVDTELVDHPARGERLLAAGGGDREAIELAGAFSAKSLEIEPQTIEVRMFVEDYFPGRERVYSPAYLFTMLSPEQHFIWITEQFNKWHRQALEVRDREMQLHQTNLQLRLLPPEELELAATRRRIEAQSAAESANSRRLAALVAGGEELARQAMRNPDFDAASLEKWAEMLQILKDIAGNRMPNVADLLRQSHQARSTPPGPTPPSSRSAGQNKSAPAPSGDSQPNAPKPATPKLADAESSQQPPGADDNTQAPNKNSSAGKFGLPTTAVADPRSGPQSPVGQKLDEAARAQQDLLAEFEKIADELSKAIANLEGSTLVKRLKAASREQYAIAGRITDHLGHVFGSQDSLKPARNREKNPALDALGKMESESSHAISILMDDMQAYFDRRRLRRVKTVLDDMRKEDAIGGLRQLGDDLRGEIGMSIAQCEFWSDAFDRWADDLAEPACDGACPSGKSKSSLPPSIVLEALQIIEAEVNLRDETRVAQQARSGLTAEEYRRRAEPLASTQDSLARRVGKLVERIRGLPDGEVEFRSEIGLLGEVEAVMDDARSILARPETGPPAIGAETEAIELLLRSKKINPRGGGGGGDSPGGGGGGTTNQSALALLGAGLNEQEVREDRGVSQSTGSAGVSLPEEFRDGLDEYFNRLEQERPGEPSHR